MGKHGALLGRLMSERKVAGNHLESELIDRVEQVRGHAGRSIWDEEVRFDALYCAHSSCHDWMRRFKLRVVLPHRLVLAQYVEEPSIVCGRPIASCAFAILDDSLYCPSGAVK